MRKNAFTLPELLIAVIIIAILIAMAISMYPGIGIRLKMLELYKTVDTIARAEGRFYAQHGFYTSQDKARGHQDFALPYTVTQEDIDKFQKVLRVKMPGPDSTFIYGVYYDPAYIYVRVRGHAQDPSEGGWWVLCAIALDGPDKGKWMVSAYNPWSKYLNPPAEKVMNYTFTK